MKSIIIAFLAALSVLPSVSFGQTNSPKVGWFFTPEFSVMLHGDHLGNTVGFQAGITLLDDHLKIGLFGYGRSGPINPQEYTLVLPTGQTYKGQSEVQVRADQGAFGITIAPQFSLSESWSIDIPLQFGQMGAGFYLFGENRNTPDGRRVSEWENELMGDNDAGFSLMYEGGVRLHYAFADHMKLLLGVHYTIAPGWESFVGGTDFYNLPRVSVGIEFGG